MNTARFVALGRGLVSSSRRETEREREREREQMDHPALYEDKCDVSDQSGGAPSLPPSHRK